MVREIATEKLFSYGTLRQEKVQLETFGRRLMGRSVILPGFCIELLEITDADVLTLSGEAYHPILRYTGRAEDQTEGVVFDITQEELAKADAYEVSDYQRQAHKTAEGQTVWVYVGVTEYA